MRTMTSHLAYAAVTLCALLVLGVPQAFGGAEVVVTSCDQSFNRSSGRTRVVLGNDLDCTGVGGISFFRHAGSVNLAGFTITGGATAVQASRHGCKVFSDPPGGTITGQTAYGIKCGRSATVRDVTFTGGGSAGGTAIMANGRIKLTRVTISNWYAGARSFGDDHVRASIKVVDSLIDNNVTYGIFSGQALIVKNSVITNNGDFGISTGDFGARANLKNSVVSGNGGDGIRTWWDATTTIKDSEVVGNGGIGVLTTKFAKITSSIIADNGLIGVQARHVRIKDANVTGNGTSADCGVTIGCADLASDISAPRLLGTSTCDTSWDTTSGIPGTNWGVCSLD